MQSNMEELDSEDSGIQDVGPQINDLMVQILETISLLLVWMRQKCLEMAVFICVVVLVFWVALFLYASFYYSFMPTASFMTPVHFYYRTDCPSPHLTVCSFPVANMSLLKNGKHQVMTNGQPYQIILEMEMPESPTNQQLGMFLVKMTPISKSGQIIEVSLRSTMLHYRSSLLQVLRTVVLSPLLISGALEQKQWVTVELFSEFKDDSDKPAVEAVIEVHSQHIQIYMAHLYIFAHFKGIRYVLHHFPLMSAVIGITSNFTFIIALGFLQISVEERNDIEDHNEQSGPENSDTLDHGTVNSIQDLEESENSRALPEEELICEAETENMVLRHRPLSEDILRSPQVLTDSLNTKKGYRPSVCSSS
ncbi:hypothetical protein DNTS_031611 [Danionella cerebrum]|uniref:Seipin n=1 Tax=Danionella cerebrum TaxID=2873325 RepID=A0A553QJP0_9TELE|nr:hypothetical protein DNTS_031611 [Danionella translucida]